MKQIALVAWREFITQVRNKTFIIMTFLTPVILLAIGLIILWMNRANTNTKVVGVVDESEQIISAFTSDSEFKFIPYPPSELQNLKDSLLAESQLDAVLSIPFDSGRLDKIEKESELFTAGSFGIQVTRDLEKKIESKIEKIRWANEGIDQNTLDQTSANVGIKIFNVKEGKEDRGSIMKYIVSAVLTYVIFMFIMIYGVRVMRGVVEEKNNRVIEIIISSLKPFNLMMGKILGTTGVALVQFILWIGGTVLISSLLLIFISPEPETVNAQAEQMHEAQKLMASNDLMMDIRENVEILFELNYPLIIFSFLIYFVLGYLFYSAVFAAIGSAVDSDTDTQQFTFIPIFPLMIATYGSYFSVMQNPDGPVAFWLSIIPITSPIAMVTRVPFEVPWWHLALSIGLLILFTWLMIRGAAKIYRVGILMYGKKASFKEIVKWLKYS